MICKAEFIVPMFITGFFLFISRDGCAQGLAQGKHFIFQTNSGDNYVMQPYKGATFKVIPVEEGITKIEVRYLSENPRENRGPFNFTIDKKNLYWESGLDGGLFFPSYLNHTVEVKSDKNIMIFLNFGGYYLRNPHGGYAVPSVDGSGKLFYAWLVTSEDPQTKKPEENACVRIIALQPDTVITIKGQEDKKAFGKLAEKEETRIKMKDNKFIELNYGCAWGFREITSTKPILVYVTPCSLNNFTMLHPTYESGKERYVGKEFYGGVNPYPSNNFYPCIVVTCLEDNTDVYIEEMKDDGTVVKKTQASRTLTQGEEYTFYLTSGVPWYRIVSTKDIYAYTSRAMLNGYAYTRDTLFLPDINGVFCGSDFIVNIGMETLAYSSKPKCHLTVYSFDGKFSPFSMQLEDGYSLLGCPRVYGQKQYLVSFSDPGLVQYNSAYSATYAIPVDSPVASIYLGPEKVKKINPPKQETVFVPKKVDNEFKNLSVEEKIARFRNEYLLKKRPVKIIGFGDSVTQSARVSGAETFYQIIAKKLKEKYGYENITVVNRGIGGNNVFHALSRIREDVVAENPQLVFVMFGVNDGYRGMNIPVFEKNMKKIIEILETETNALIVVLGPTPLTTDREAFRSYDKAVEKLSKEKKIPFISMQEIIMTQPEWDNKLYTDFCHPGPEGHKIMAEGVWKLLENEK
ncbi:MAG: GDSL-type esterase/lipase family protein [bacterium]|nr:GDSL-type esterase/lipase family protein [bacterium]